MTTKEKTGQIFVAESFDFGDLPSVPVDYDLRLAKAAAKRRAKRRGRLAMGNRNRGFNDKVSKLWVPHSQGENSAVVNGPAQDVAKTQAIVAGKIKTKRQGEISDAQLSSRIRYADRQIARKAQAQYLAYSLDADTTLKDLVSVLDSDRTYSRAAIEESDTAMTGLFSYFKSLETFVGAATRDNGNRQWANPNHTRITSAAHARFVDFLSGISEDETRQFYDEAVWSEWSRERYWKKTWQEQEVVDLFPSAYGDDYPPTLLPVEAYANLPEYHGFGTDE